MAYLFDENKSKIDFNLAIQPKLDALQTAFQNSVNLIYNKFVSQGTTPTAKTPAAISTAVDTLATTKYNAGKAAGTAAAEAVTWVGDELEFSLYNNQYSVEFDARTVKSFRWNASNSDAKVRCYKTNGTYSTIDFVAYGSTNEHTLGNDVVRLWINCQSGYCHCMMQFTYQMKLKN